MSGEKEGGADSQKTSLRFPDAPYFEFPRFGVSLILSRTHLRKNHSMAISKHDENRNVGMLENGAMVKIPGEKVEAR